MCERENKPEEERGFEIWEGDESAARNKITLCEVGGGWEEMTLFSIKYKVLKTVFDCSNR